MDTLTKLQGKWSPLPSPQLQDLWMGGAQERCPGKLHIFQTLPGSRAVFDHFTGA